MRCCRTCRKLILDFLSYSLSLPFLSLIYLLAILSAVLFDSFWQSKAKLWTASWSTMVRWWCECGIRTCIDHFRSRARSKGIGCLRSSSPLFLSPSNRSSVPFCCSPRSPRRNCNCKRFIARRGLCDVVSKRIFATVERVVSGIIKHKRRIPSTLEPIYDSGNGIRHV